MTRITSPLFANWAKGRIGPLGSFRQGSTGPQLIQPGASRRPASPRQLTLRALFTLAHTQWMALEPSTRPIWGIFWPDWYRRHTHPPQPATALKKAIYGDARLPRFAHDPLSAYWLES